ncbi:MAG: rhodanese-like domain-containing protein [Micromonosporaceae bacterium]
MFGQRVPSVSVNEIPADAYLLDVREDDEWVAGHAPGARHVPMSDVPSRLDEVPTERDVVVVCRSGGRSGKIVEFLRARGWDNVLNLDGGMKDWAASGRPLVSEDGSEPRVI